MEHKRIVLRSLKVISRFDPIQIYNSTIEQQFIQSSSLYRPVSQPVSQFACYLFNARVLIYTQSTRYTLNKSTTHITSHHTAQHCQCACVQCTLFIFLWGRCQLQTNDSVRVLAQHRDVRINDDNDRHDLFYCVIQLCIWLKHVYK